LAPRRGRPGPERTWGIASTEVADADLARLKKINRSAYQEVDHFIKEVLAVDPSPPGAEELRPPWEGCQSIHIGRDRYRVIWEVDLEIQVVYVLRVGPKKRRGGGTIYDAPRPPRRDWRNSQGQ
jgi:mRNA-degrading endonuclease RelE of RelBE toxin-antitoxin system